ncbi:hypothetical protein CR513_61442, partial [Mucuna pruriens]
MTGWGNQKSIDSGIQVNFLDLDPCQCPADQRPQQAFERDRDQSRRSREDQDWSITRGGVWYPTWLANVMMVEKINDRWRMYTKENRHCEALAGVFVVLKRHKLKLNLEKCSFDILAGKFLRFMLKQRGTKASLKKHEEFRKMTHIKKYAAKATIARRPFERETSKERGIREETRE